MAVVRWTYWFEANLGVAVSHRFPTYLNRVGLRQQMRFWSRLSDLHVFWSPSAKSSHPKKTGCTTKNPSSTLHPRGAKDAGAVAPNGRKDARTNWKADRPTSSTQKTAESSGQPAELKSSPRLSQGIPTSLSDQGGARGASGPGSSPQASAASEGTHDGGAPEPQRGAPEGRNATEDTSCTGGELDCSCGGERSGRTRGEGGEGQRKDEEESSVESSLR